MHGCTRFPGMIRSSPAAPTADIGQQTAIGNTRGRHSLHMSG